MSLREEFLKLLDAKESAFVNKKDMKIPEELLSQSADKIVDGLINTFNKDEELALRALNKHLFSVNDGYKEKNPQVYSAKEKLEKIVEAKKESLDISAEDMDKDDALSIQTAEEIENSGLNMEESNFRKLANNILNEYFEKNGLKEWGNYPDDYNPSRNPYEQKDSDDDESYQNYLDENLYTAYAILLSKDENGTPLLDHHGYALDPKYGLLYAFRDYNQDGTPDFESDNSLKKGTTVYETPEEANQMFEEFKQAHPEVEGNLVKVYSLNQEDWYATQEEAYPYEEYQEDQYYSYDESVDNNLNFSQWCLNYLDQDNSKKEASDADKPNRAYRDDKVYKDRNAAKIDEMLAYVENGIHPDMDYEKPMWRWLTPDGEKRVFVLDGIDKKTNLSDKETYVYIRPVYIVRDNQHKGYYKKWGEIEAIPATTFVKITQDPLNKEIYNKILKGKSENPDDWREEILAANKCRQVAYDTWYRQNKDLLDLDSYDKFDAQRIYQMIVKQGYAPREALKKFENKKKIDEASLKDTVNTDVRQLREILPQLGIDPQFIDMPLTLEYPDMGDDTEPTRKFVIVGVEKQPIERINDIYVRDWDNGGRMFPMDLKTVKELADRPENQDPEPDIWDLASTPNKQSRAFNKGTTGHWEDLTKDDVIEALKEMEKRPEFQGIDLVNKFLAPQTFETRNPLVLKALKMLDPDTAIKPTRSKYGFNGMNYQIFIPEVKGMRPKNRGHDNPYRDLTKTKW